jgi:hypothetical protein
MKESNFKSRSLKEIIEEWKAIRSATMILFTTMSEEMADRMGKANGTELNARILLYFILMHERHHIQVMKDRYLLSAAAI